MYNGKRVIVVMPAYNAEQTIVKTCEEVKSQPFIDHIVVVDDGSSDRTEQTVRDFLPDVTFVRHEKNRGYGANQKTCYRLAMAQNADIIIMVHPDYQYTPLLLPAMVSMIGNGLYHCVLGTRILGGYALRGGMPLYKYVSNRILTFIENIFLQAKLSEYHTGYRAFSRELLERLDLSGNSDDFVFDNQMLAQIIWTGCMVGEISCPTKYFKEASSINFRRSTVYGIGCLMTSLSFRLAKWHLRHSRFFPKSLENSLAK